MKPSNCPKLPEGLSTVSLELPKGWKKINSGKVRELYVEEEKELLLTVTTDRISAFDAILPRPIPYKGAVLNLLNARFLRQAEEVIPHWMQSCPAPQLMIGRYAKPLAVECIVRGHLSGHAWRSYQAGERQLCGEILPKGLYEHAELPHPIFTPSTKAKAGRTDEYIRPSDILDRGLLSPLEFRSLRSYALSLYNRGVAYAKSRGLRLMDAKYEFGTYRDQIYLIDELHTPDAARYCEEQAYQSYLSTHKRGHTSSKTALKQLSKESLREYLLQRQQAGVAVSLPDSEVEQLSRLYVSMYEKLTAEPFSAAGISCEASVLQAQALSGIRSLAQT